LSALSGVDPELHESARIDGASLVQRILHVDLPTILPTIMIMFILNCGHVLGVGYEKIYLLQNTLNVSTSEVISTYVYKQGLASAIPQYSYSTAVGLFVSVVNLVMLALVNGMSKRMSKTSLW
nr:ABC transporter permease subunit [Clostridia bacterium]